MFNNILRRDTDFSRICKFKLIPVFPPQNTNVTRACSEKELRILIALETIAFRKIIDLFVVFSPLIPEKCCCIPLIIRSIKNGGTLKGCLLYTSLLIYVYHIILRYTYMAAGILSSSRALSLFNLASIVAAI